MENCNIRKNKQNQPVYAKENCEAEKKEKNDTRVTNSQKIKYKALAKIGDKSQCK